LYDRRYPKEFGNRLGDPPGKSTSDQKGQRKFKNWRKTGRRGAVSIGKSVGNRGQEREKNSSVGGGPRRGGNYRPSPYKSKNKMEGNIKIYGGEKGERKRVQEGGGSPKRV